MEICLDRLQNQMLNSDPLTNEEMVEQEVFKNAYIPKNLNEVHVYIYCTFLSKFHTSNQFFILQRNRLLISKEISV